MYSLYTSKGVGWFGVSGLTGYHMSVKDCLLNANFRLRLSLLFELQFIKFVNSRCSVQQDEMWSDIDLLVYLYCSQDSYVRHKCLVICRRGAGFISGIFNILNGTLSENDDK